MKPPPMPDHWFQQYLAQLAPPGRSPLHPYDETLKLWRAGIRDVAQRQWHEAVVTGIVEGVKVAPPTPMTMMIHCDQQACRLLTLQVEEPGASPQG